MTPSACLFLQCNVLWILWFWLLIDNCIQKNWIQIPYLKVKRIQIPGHDNGFGFPIFKWILSPKAKNVMDSDSVRTCSQPMHWFKIRCLLLLPNAALSGSDGARQFRQLLLPNAPSTFSKFYVFGVYQCSHFRRLLFLLRRLLWKVRTTLPMWWLFKDTCYGLGKNSQNQQHLYIYGMLGKKAFCRILKRWSISWITGQNIQKLQIFAILA